MKRKPKLIELHWLDCLQRASWKSGENIETMLTDTSDMECRTVGFLIAENETVVIVAATTGPPDKEFGEHEDKVLGPLVIPRGAITEMWEIVV
jgi:hypothetical protein